MELKLFKISNGALKGDSLPKRLKILSWGDNPTTDGPVKIGQKTIDGIAAQGKTGFDRVAIDFDHCSVSTTSTYKALLAEGQVPLIFGYGTPRVVKDEGLFLEDVIWTRLGQKNALNFEDLSPALSDKDGEVTFLHSVALTPNGKVKDLQFFSEDLKLLKADITTADLGDEAEDSTDAADAASSKAVESGKDSDHAKASKLHGAAMVANTKAGNDDQAAKHAKAMKMHDAFCEAGDDTKTMSVTDSMKPEELTLLITKGIEAGLKPMSERLEKLETSIATGAKATEDKERDRLVHLFSADGKSPKGEDGKDLSLDDLKKKDVTTLKLLHANTPVTVPLSARGRTAQIGDEKVKTYVERDPVTKKILSVDMASLFNDENKRNGQDTPNAAAERN